MKKVLCKWSKAQIAKNKDQLLEIVSEPRHLCKDCGRVADQKKWLCKPEKI
jgi:hypothetical protein